MVKTVVWEHKWTLEQAMQLYVDDEDMEGLLFWYNDIAEEIERMKGKK